MRWIVTGLISLGAIAAAAESVSAADRPNVLFIAVDDLRVELGCYGDTLAITPNVDRLASRGLLFRRAYCQQAVCNPSRASLMTGMRPDTLGVWDLVTHFRQHHPDVVTLPQLFKQNGYFSQDIGKIFHNWRQDDYRGDPRSWSVPARQHYANHGNDKPMVEGQLPPDHSSGLGQTESRDVSDEAYYDGRVADDAVATLGELNGRPFFFAVGFWKPHLPFNAPKKYWDMYDRSEIDMPFDGNHPENVPEIALQDYKIKDGAPPTAEEIREIRHGHLAAISYMDAQIGKVLDELDRLDLTKNTIIVFWSDHGLHLGEHGLWSKTTNFEIDARVPLIIATPEMTQATQTSALVECIDIYPTLAELCDLSVPETVEGQSLVPLIDDPAATLHTVAMTQTPRPPYPRGKKPQAMGYSVRGDDYRYTEWRDYDTGKVIARELYNHQTDPHETVNVVDEKKNKDVVEQLAKELDALTQVRYEPEFKE